MEILIIFLVLITLLLLYFLFQNLKPEQVINNNTYDINNLDNIFNNMFNNSIELYKLNRFQYANKTIALIQSEVNYLKNNKQLNDTLINTIKIKQQETKSILIRLNAYKSNEKIMIDNILNLIIQ